MQGNKSNTIIFQYLDKQISKYNYKYLMFNNETYNGMTNLSVQGNKSNTEGKITTAAGFSTMENAVETGLKLWESDAS